MKNKTAVIIGAGPAGLTAALELLERSNIRPVVLEECGEPGGISKTLNYKGNLIDIGGHRFFSRSQKILDRWQSILPLQGKPSIDDKILGRDLPFSLETGAPDPEISDDVMLVRRRLSRILYSGKFFDYPVSLNRNTIMNLGLNRILRIGTSYLHSRLFPVRKEVSLEDFFINRFGKELYMTFFKEYTEKVWGCPCNRIDALWGVQRIKGLSLFKALLHAARTAITAGYKIQGKIETSLIGQFYYPKFGPGQLWRKTASKVLEKGGEIYYNRKAVNINVEPGSVKSVGAMDMNTGKLSRVGGDYFISTMPVKDLIGAFVPAASGEAADIASGLEYRDFITAGILADKLAIGNGTKIKTIGNIIPDNWIYVQEPGVKVGRLQIFNNWSPYMVNDRRNVWVGMEYFCSRGDELWSKSDEEFKLFAIDELTDIGIAEKKHIKDAYVARVLKTYPSYTGKYERFGRVREYLDGFKNLFLIGRNGMHRYNNMDHSMMTAMAAVENIIAGETSKKGIWDINTESDYNESR